MPEGPCGQTGEVGKGLIGDQIPWTGGISNRQILLDTARSVTVWAAVSISLGMFLWWATSSIQFPGLGMRGPLCGVLVVLLGGPITRWCRRA